MKTLGGVLIAVTVLATAAWLLWPEDEVPPVAVPVEHDAVAEPPAPAVELPAPVALPREPEPVAPPTSSPSEPTELTVRVLDRREFAIRDAKVECRNVAGDGAYARTDGRGVATLRIVSDSCELSVLSQDASASERLEALHAGEKREQVVHLAPKRMFSYQIVDDTVGPLVETTIVAEYGERRSDSLTLGPGVNWLHLDDEPTALRATNERGSSGRRRILRRSSEVLHIRGRYPLRLDVRGSNGRPVCAMVWVNGEPVSVKRGYGEARVDDGTLDVVAMGCEKPEFTVVELPRPPDGQKLRIDLEKFDGIRGIVTSPAGPVAGVRVVAIERDRDVAAQQPVDTVHPTGQLEHAWDAVTFTDRLGRFVLPVAIGTERPVNVHVFAPGLRERQTPLTVPRIGPPLTIELIRDEPTAAAPATP